MSQNCWIGVDLDGTLAHYDEWRGSQHIGAPILGMVERVKQWRSMGVPVRIFTARVCQPEPGVVRAIEDWCLAFLGEVLPVTCVKDYGMIQLWDDRAVQVVKNTGEPVEILPPIDGP